MLFVTKKETRKQVTEAVRPLIRMVETTGDIPEGFWGDKVILGFLSGTMHGLTNIVSNGKYKGADTGEIVVGVYTDLAGATAAQAIASLTVSLLTDETFKAALNAGFMSVLIARHGPEKAMDDPLVIRAVAHAKKTKGMIESVTDQTSEAASVSSAIQTLVYHARVEALRG